MARTQNSPENVVLEMEPQMNGQLLKMSLNNTTNGETPFEKKIYS